MSRLILVYFFFAVFVVNGQNYKTLSIQEQKEDINYIQFQLEQLHPGIYSYQSKDEFDNAFDSLKNNLLPDQTVFDFYRVLVPVINNIGCGHTTVKLPGGNLKKLEKSRKYLPFEIRIIDDRIYILKTYPTNQDIQPGTEILSINGISSILLIKQGLPLYPSDGRIQSRKYHKMERYFSIDYSKFHYVLNGFDLVLKENDKTRNIHLDGISYHDYIKRAAKPELPEMSFELIDSLSAAIITVRNSSSKKIFSGFLESTFRQIQDKKIKNLIIDLRYDSFNRDNDGALLYSYITDTTFSYYKKLEVTAKYDVPKALRWITHYPIEQDSTGKYYWTIHPELNLQAPQENPYSGNVFVLTNGFTFSATAEFSAIVKSNNRGLIVGLETGGGYYGNNSGGMFIRKLPNSKLRVVVPPMKYIMAVEDMGNYSRGVIPDILVTEKANNIDSGEDKILEKTLILVQGSK